jgi:hypothetical protein
MKQMTDQEYDNHPFVRFFTKFGKFMSFFLAGMNGYMLLFGGSVLLSMKLFGGLQWSWWAILIPLYPHIVALSAVLFLLSLMGLGIVLKKIR